MNYYGGKEMAESFRTVRKNTMTIAEEIPEERYSFRAAPETRSIGELLAHIALAKDVAYQIHGVERRTSLGGFDFPAHVRRLIATEREPRTKAQTIEMLRSGGEQFSGWLGGLTDEFLGEVVQARPGVAVSKTRFEMLLGVKEHEMHHRGQLMLIERMIGIVPHLTREMHARMAAAPKT